MATVYKRASAKRDLVEDFVYLAEHAGIETAERFLLSADESFSEIARHPGMGKGLKLTDLRKWRVNGFEKFLIFYLPRANGVCYMAIRIRPKSLFGSGNQTKGTRWSK